MAGREVLFWAVRHCPRTQVLVLAEPTSPLPGGPDELTAPDGTGESPPEAEGEAGSAVTSEPPASGSDGTQQPSEGTEGTKTSGEGQDADPVLRQVREARDKFWNEHGRPPNPDEMDGLLAQSQQGQGTQTTTPTTDSAETTPPDETDDTSTVSDEEKPLEGTQGIDKTDKGTSPDESQEPKTPPEENQMRYKIGDLVYEKNENGEMVVGDHAKWFDGTVTVNVDANANTGEPISSDLHIKPVDPSRSDLDDFKLHLGGKDPNSVSAEFSGHQRGMEGSADYTEGQGRQFAY